MSTTDSVIRARGLSKHFGRVRALDGLDLDIAPGEVHGFLGPNGAGKSTTIRILLGLLRPSSGAVTLFGRDPWRDAVDLHRRLAYVPGDVDLWPGLTGGETIDALLRMRGGYDRARRDELVERFDLDTRRKTRTYSKGNRQKVALIAALASDVELLLLDEPTAGLDPLMEIVFQDVVAETRAGGTSVFLSSHTLAQVEALADRISIVRDGRVVESGSLAELRHMTRTTLEFVTELPAEGLAERPGIHAVRAEHGRTVCEVDGEQLPAVISTLAPLGVRTLQAHPPTLEQLLIRHYGAIDGRHHELAGAGS